MEFRTHPSGYLQRLGWLRGRWGVRQSQSTEKTGLFVINSTAAPIVVAIAGPGTSIAEQSPGIPKQVFGTMGRKSVMTPEPTLSNDDMLRRAQGEFLEMPGLRLTEPQARRLWGLDRDACATLLSTLVDAHFLFRTREGAFMRVEQPTPLRASLRSRMEKIAAA